MVMELTDKSLYIIRETKPNQTNFNIGGPDLPKQATINLAFPLIILKELVDSFTSSHDVCYF